MYIALIVFMVLAAVVCIFAMVVVIVDLVRGGDKRASVVYARPAQTADGAENEAPREDSEVQTDTVAVAETEAKEELGENTVVISRTERKTLDEKFRELDERMQRYYIEIVRHAMNKPASKQFKNDRYEEYKIGNTRLVRLQIKKDAVICEVTLVNSDFRTYMADNKVRVKQAPTVIRIEDEASVELAKNGIDIAVKGVEEEREYKRLLRNEKRRNARKLNS